MQAKRIRASAALVALALLGPVCAGAQSGRQTGRPEQGAQSRITIVIGWGRADSKCLSGKGICIIVASAACPNPGGRIAANRRVEAVARAGNDQLAIELTTEPPEKGDTLTVDQDIALDECTSHALGYSALTVLKGEYAVEPGGNKPGRVVVKTRGRRLAAQPAAPTN